ncbi:hypothetical protein [Xinzhou toro-like virus]|uniref:M protein n=1 Tax=Xinzhou toro-like virus TaxID=1923777 RepID=A0A1L3KJ51_9NIDO|nr:hypothetical protein [Xinzhou toro-like virus]APG77356.1 hypothetical protein [Xinzhou toro-like virus]
MDLNSALSRLHQFHHDMVERIIPLDQVVQVVAYCLVLSVILRSVLYKWPGLIAMPFMTMIYNLVVVIQVVSLLAVFFLLPQPTNALQKFMLACVIIITIIVILHILYKATMFIYFLIKFRSFSIAVSGAHTLVIDNRCYPFHHDTGCIVFKKGIENGDTIYTWGDVVLPTAPKMVTYWTWNGGTHYSYAAQAKQGDCTFFIRTKVLDGRKVYYSTIY